jgi:hypothetical protein
MQDMTSYKIEQLDLTKLFPNKTNPYAIVIKNVLSKEECVNFINLTEKKGYKKSISICSTNFR